MGKGRLPGLGADDRRFRMRQAGHCAAGKRGRRSLLPEDEHPMESLRALCGMFNEHLMRSESPLGLAMAAPMLECRLALRTLLASLERGETVE